MSQASCAMWALEHFGSVTLGDERLKKDLLAWRP
jgi:hypothetical protein